MARSNMTVDTPSIELEMDKTKSFGLGEHSKDQATQTDKPIGSGMPTSGTADPDKTDEF